MRAVVTGKAAGADLPGPSRCPLQAVSLHGRAHPIPWHTRVGMRCHLFPRHRLTTQPYCEVAKPSSEL